MAHCVFTCGKREGLKRELQQESKSEISFETLVRCGGTEGQTPFESELGRPHSR